MTTFPGWINPLTCFELEPSVPGEPSAPTPDGLFRWLFDRRADAGVDAFARRYREIDSASPSLFIVPDEPHILAKLVWPLAHAKGAYALGDYLGCIAHCGTVCEMIAILLWEISSPAIAGTTLGEDAQKGLFGRTFERLGQDVRVRILLTLNLIDGPTSKAFERVRDVRNRHLHLLSAPLGVLPSDAREAYKSALLAATCVLGTSSQQGAVVLRPELRAYLIAKGVITDAPDGA